MVAGLACNVVCALEGRLDCGDEDLFHPTLLCNQEHVIYVHQAHVTVDAEKRRARFAYSDLELTAKELQEVFSP